MNRRELTHRLDVLTRQRILHRDAGKCQKCRAYVGAEGHIHHVFGKGAYPYLRWEPANLLLLCHWCHGNWHSYPEFNRGEWKYRWAPRWDMLKCLQEAGTPIGLVDMQEMADKMEGEK